ncbi:MAG TPA: malonyl-CoA decarboxylase family protein [Solirubrobacteraceae bacterium]|jgi:malonyl-CoA decarboxylase
MAARAWLSQVTSAAQRGRQFFEGTPATDWADITLLCHRLLRERGEASGLVVAGDILGHLAEASPSETEQFLTVLATDFGPDQDATAAAASRWLSSRTPQTFAALTKLVEAPRQELFRRLNMIAGGTSALVELRADLLRILPIRGDLASVDADLYHLFASWFNRGFLRLEEITWQTSADILERLTSYEAVHEMRGWRDLRGRLSADRRIFAFFHPALPREPLIFVEVALTNGLPTSVEPLLSIDRDLLDPARADTAIFFSISNAQVGLRGISFGSFLIKQVMSQLMRELPQIKTYATISPMRHFAASLCATEDPDGFTPDRLQRLLGDDVGPVRHCFETGQPAPDRVDAAMSVLALAYLTKVKSQGSAVDPVAHFHLSNGARIERINLRSDMGKHAAASCGVMVNYLYDVARLEPNHENYVERGQIAVRPTLAPTLRKIDEAW